MRKAKVLKASDPLARDNPKTLAQFEPLIMSMARKAHARGRAIGMSFEIEDFAQELRIRFCESVRKWDERKNASFMNFFITGGWWAINQIFTSYERKGHTTHETMMDDADAVIMNSAHTGLTSGNDRSDGLHIIIPSDEPTPEDRLELESTLEDVRGKLSGDSLAAFNMIVDPPGIVTDQYLSKVYGSEFDRDCGGNSRGYPEINLRFLSALFGLSQTQINKVKHDLERACVELGSE